MQHWQLGTIFLHSQIKAKWETSSCFRQNRNRSRKFRFQKTIPLSWSRIQKHTEMQQTHFCSHLQLPHWGRQAHGTSQTQILTEKHIIYLGLFRVFKVFHKSCPQHSETQALSRELIQSDLQTPRVLTLQSRALPLRPQKCLWFPKDEVFWELRTTTAATILKCEAF